MRQKNISKQIKDNLVALLSLFIAIIALTYTAWREEQTERNFTTRLAAFELLKHLGELQLVVNYSHYSSDNQIGNPLLGWGHLALIGDLSQLMPTPIPATVNQLIDVWSKDWKNIRTDQESADKISKEIDLSREKVLEALYYLK